MTNKHKHRKHIIVVGGGFAGLNFIKQLFNNKYYTVTLIDKNNYNYFTPLLYQVATSFLEPSSISYPFRKFFKNKDIKFRNASLVRVDPSINKVYLSDGDDVNFDYLVFAAGTRTNFFGNESIRKNSFSLKGIDDALFMRNEMIKNLEKASIANDPDIRKKLLTIVIAGGGPTGVELAGMFAEMSKRIIGGDYPELNEPIEIHLIDTASDVLTSMSDKSQDDAYNILDALGVHVKLNTMVTQYEKERVHLSNGEHIDTSTLIWCAGVTANVFDGISARSIGKGMRMISDQYNRVVGYENIFAIGDISIQHHDKDYAYGHPQVTQVAIQQGKALARNLLRMAEDRHMKPFNYLDWGILAIVGRGHAFADLFKHRKVHVNGLFALLSWLIIHLAFLVNYNNKIKTFYNWMVAYITCDQALRMIFRSENRERSGDETTSNIGSLHPNKSDQYNYVEQD